MDQKWISPNYSVDKTYRSLRYLAAGALIFMPLLTAVASGLPLEKSLSAYYFARPDGGLPRTLFVMFLSFLGGVLLAYRGLNRIDNYIHNAAGAFSIAVAIFPMKCSDAHCVPGLGPTWIHGLSAGLLFVGAMASVAYSGGAALRNKLDEVGDETLKGRLRKIKLFSGGLMLFGVVAFVYGGLARLETPYVFVVEYLGFFGFGVYWIRLMWLIDAANQRAGHPPNASSAHGTPAKDIGTNAPAAADRVHPHASPRLP